MRVCVVVFALADVEVCRASVTEAPGKSLRNDEHGEYYSRCSVTERTQFAVSDENLIDDIV